MMDMKKFCENVAKKYAEERIKETDEIKQEELKMIEKYIRKEYKILDLCCGPGTFLVPLTKQGYDIEGIDFSRNMLKEAKKYAEKERVKIRISLGDARNIGRKENVYDLVLLMGDSIGAIPGSKNRQKVINECFRVLKNGGILIITFGNRYASIKWTIKLFLLWLRKLFSKEKIEFGDWVYELYGERGIHHNYSKKEAIKSLKNAGFKILEIKKVSYKMIFVAKK